MVTPRLLADRYRLERPLAFGGFAEVWTAVDVVLDRRVAIKMLRPDPASDPIIVERFRLEAVSAARLNHPNIVTVFDTISEPGVEAVVMDLIPGRTLREQLDDQGRLSIQETVHIGVCIADALDAAHRAGLVHRDVKPANILITPARRVLLTDFGIAVAANRTSDLTGENTVLGTAKYLSPEQVMGLPTGPESDLYSLGIVLYECLSGRVPFTGDTSIEIAHARVNQDPQPLRTLRTGLPRALDDLIERLHDRRPERRPASAAEVRDALVRLDGTLVDDDERLVVDPTPSGTIPISISTTPRPSDGPRLDLLVRHQTQDSRFVGAIGVICAVAAVLVVLGVAARSGAGQRILQSVRPGQGAAPRGASTTTTLPPGSPAASTVAPGTPHILSVTEYDPPPGDGLEHPEQLLFLTDRNPDTTWASVCYGERNMAPKRGIGLVVEFDSARVNGVLEVESPSDGWTAKVYSSPDKKYVNLIDWLKPVAEGKDVPAGTAKFPLGDQPTKFALVWITNLAPSQSCVYPWAMRIAELKLTSSS